MSIPAEPVANAPAFELSPATDAGHRAVTLAEKHAEQFLARAEEHDRDGTFPHENFAEMQRSGFMACTVAAEFGGIGLDSLHDMMVAMNRLARGDASTAIAANMHLAGAAVIGRLLRRARAEGDAGAAAVIEDLLSRVGSGSTVMCYPTTERGTDLTSPMTTATPVDGGYLVNGRKIFGTISPAADLFFPSVRVPKDDGGYLTATAAIPREADGLQVEDNWDALGMRASGSNDITFTDCFVPKDMLFAVRDNYARAGQGFADFALTANLPLISTFLGIAEAARDHALHATTKRKGPKKKALGDRIPIQQLVAEIEIDLAVCRAMVERVGRIADEFLKRYATTDAPSAEGNALMKETQCMKYVVNRKAIEVVDRAMTVTGGGAYMGRHPLARLYRDSRAGPFMQPYAPYEALEYIGKVTLGMDPTVDR
ncbi:acyl-CoA dehydrogenase family protein [Saccharopolyspora taberi]|uniref:Acyl-CoA dehydrogenase family protein n=1 Tax=Saccharopolyspora taberi TaxID=60895 RepID=A0ABN3VEV6_9PSEU